MPKNTKQQETMAEQLKRIAKKMEKVDETTYLLNSKKNKERLSDSLDQIKNGKAIVRGLIKDGE